MNNKLMFSSVSAEWETPQALFDVLNSICAFTIDVCATNDNAKCRAYWTADSDGLSKEWCGSCWMNPPYGRVISHWMKKAYLESRKPAVSVVCLVPARTDTAWWHNYALCGKVLFFRGRLKFVNRAFPSWRADGDFKVSSAPFPSALVIYGGNMNEIWSRLQQQLTAAGMPCA